MWWLTIPVIVYAAGMLTLWVILVRHHDAPLPAAEYLPESESASGGPGSAALPGVSVVVAARNEEKHITKLLESLVRQEYPSHLLEIIVVNDSSTDRTPVAVSEFMEAHRERVKTGMRLLLNPFSGKKKAIRLGVTRSAGDLILTTDADCTIGPGWVRAHVAEYLAARPSMVLAPVVQRAGRGFWSRFGVFEFSALQAVTEATALSGHPVMCNAANMSFAREVYLRHAGELRDDLPSGDDIFLLHAVRRVGGTVGYAGSSAAAVETAAAVTAAALLRQRARWASKGWYYSDPAILILAAATAACNAAVTAAAVAAFISVQYIPLAAAMYALKTVPDYLLISGEMKKNGSRVKKLPFIISELVYPFWFVTVAIASLLPGAGRFAKKESTA